MPFFRSTSFSSLACLFHSERWLPTPQFNAWPQEAPMPAPCITQPTKRNAANWRDVLNDAGGILNKRAVSDWQLLQKWAVSQIERMIGWIINPIAFLRRKAVITNCHLFQFSQSGDTDNPHVLEALVSNHKLPQFLKATQIHPCDARIVAAIIPHFKDYNRRGNTWPVGAVCNSESTPISWRIQWKKDIMKKRMNGRQFRYLKIRCNLGKLPSIT